MFSRTRETHCGKKNTMINETIGPHKSNLNFANDLMGLELSLSRVNFSVVISNEKKYKVKKSA
jgi:hypothetical protein